MSATPNGSISGIHPAPQRIREQNSRRETQIDMQHTSGVLERKAPLVHLVLLDMPSWQMVHAPRRVPLHLQFRRAERPLLPHKNIEVVVGGMQPRVSLRAEGRPEHNEVLSDARVDDVHRAHRAARVAQDPLGGVGVDGHAARGVLGAEVVLDVLDHEPDVVRLWRGCDRGLRELVQALGVEDVPLVLCAEQRVSVSVCACMCAPSLRELNAP